MTASGLPPVPEPALPQPRGPLPKSKNSVPSTKSSPPAGPEPCARSLPPGQAFDVSVVIDARTGERFVAAGPPNDCWLVTSPRVADATEKKRLASTYSAALVDMEAAGIARLARMRGIPFYCIKGISDGYSDQLPDFNRFISTRRPVQTGSVHGFCAAPSLVLARDSSGWAKIAGRLPATSRSLCSIFWKNRGPASTRNGNPNHQR